ncbi:class I SAM-dependent methyltransferase [Dongia soli]|uniref:S-adenosyl-L-methionine-dependent methyltransferase n=1 Tax=Dongia soli TaxID=600628 RepID=A0ABU5EFX9_9PROT|nr:class I SAM-dependent methyltransferase [Dongia soli]MDY0884914.1 class I SAM-dependent methyltransferase [Dongia soli]
MTTTGVHVTADGLVDLRLHNDLAKRLKLHCPYDHLFWTKEGRDLAGMAIQLDPVFAQHNLARYKWFSGQMTKAAGSLDQILILGAGFDTRSLTLPRVTAGKLQVFEVDFPAKLAQKQEVLGRAGVVLPPALHFVGADLADPALLSRLEAAGYRADRPTAIFMEGVLFFLPREVADSLLDPTRLKRGAGSFLFLDIWSRSRQIALNEKLTQRGAPALFGESPLGETPAEAEQQIKAHGYGHVRTTSLQQLVETFQAGDIADPLGDSWHVLEAVWP